MQQEFGLYEVKVEQRSIAHPKSGGTVDSATEQFLLNALSQLGTDYSVSAQHRQLKELNVQLTEHIEQLTEQRARSAEQIAQLRTRLKTLRASTSWRLTAPMRRES